MKETSIRFHRPNTRRATPVKHDTLGITVLHESRVLEVQSVVGFSFFELL